MARLNDYFNKPLNLLPNYFKKIGLGFIIASVVFVVSLKIFGIHLSAEKKEMMKIILSDVFLLGMVIVAFSKDKDEDELTMLIRMKALGSAVVFVVIFKIVNDIFHLTTQVSNETMNGYFFQMMVWYFFVYYSSKRIR
jgi:hypothetical protein